VCFDCDCSGLDITYQGVAVKGNTLVIKDIVALGSLASNLGKVISPFYRQVIFSVKSVSVCSLHSR